MWLKEDQCMFGLIWPVSFIYLLFIIFHESCDSVLLPQEGVQTYNIVYILSTFSLEAVKFSP